MWLVSLSVMAICIFAEYYMWTVDYWYPDHLFGGRIGIEDFLISFTQGGIAAVIYEEVFRKRLYKRKGGQVHNFGLLFFIVLPIIVIAFLFYGLRMYSFDAWNLGMLFVVIALVLVRKDLFKTCLFSGTTFLISLWPIYWITSLVSPGWVEKFWFMSNLSGFSFIGIPIEDHIFYFLVGAILGPFYEYWQGGRLRRLS